jgi:hypothetical protein
MMMKSDDQLRKNYLWENWEEAIYMVLKVSRRFQKVPST